MKSQNSNNNSRKANTKDCSIFVISKNRPKNIEPTYQNVLGSDEKLIKKTVWLVPDEESFNSYDKTGLIQIQNLVNTVTNNIAQIRNEALKRAFALDHDCLILEDDIKKLQKITINGNPEQIFLDEFLELVEQCDKDVCSMPYLYGAAITNNTFFYNPAKPISFNTLINGSIMYIKNKSDIYFDEAMERKEDYDFVIQHIFQKKNPCRMNYILSDYKRTKVGSNERSIDTEELSIKHLQQKWSRDIVKLNKKRPHEIKLSVKGRL